jgi:hypothetical protein
VEILAQERGERMDGKGTRVLMMKGKGNNSQERVLLRKKLMEKVKAKEMTPDEMTKILRAVLFRGELVEMDVDELIKFVLDEANQNHEE